MTSPIVRPDGTTIDGETTRGAAPGSFETRLPSKAALVTCGMPRRQTFAQAHRSFPAAFWDAAAPAFAVATESADLAEDACRAPGNAATAYAALRTSITAHGQRLDAIGEAAWP